MTKVMIQMIRACRLLQIGLFISFFIGKAALAQPDLNIQYDKPSFIQAAENIVNVKNFYQLKLGFFSHQAQKQMGQAEGWDILNQKLGEQKPSSLKWLMMSNVLAHAAFEIDGKPEDLQSKGFDLYATVFDSYSKSMDSKCIYMIESSLCDYVLTADGRFKDIGLENDPRSIDLLLKAWTLYLQIHTDRNWGNLPEPSWYKAIRSTQSEPLFQDEIKKLAQEPTTVWNADTSMTAGMTLSLIDPASAVPYLEKALKGFKEDKGNDDLRKIQKLNIIYSTLVNLSEQNNDLDKSIAYQSDAVENIHTGRANLVRLFLKDDDLDSAFATIQQMFKSTKNTSVESQDLINSLNNVYLWYKEFPVERSDALKIADFCSNQIQNLPIDLIAKEKVVKIVQNMKKTVG